MEIFMKKMLILCMLAFFCTSVSAMDISADSACLIAADTGAVIYAKNETEKRPMASTTKIMTALLAAESGKEYDIVTISANAELQEGSSIYLRRGERIKLNDLMLGLMLNSGNDAAVAIAEYISGSVDDFAKLMTETAVRAGAYNTQFKNPNGLDEPGHYTTAYDLALISAYAMKNPLFRQTVATKSASANLESGQTLYFSNHNKLLKIYDGAVGIKTGFTKSSGRCLVSAAERDGILLVAVTLNAPDDWNDHKKLLDYGFENVTSKKIASSGQVLKSLNGFDFSAAEDVVLPVCGRENFDIVLHLPKSAPSPMAKGEKAGFAEVFFENRLVKQFDIVAASDIPMQISKKSFLSCVLRVIGL